MDLTLKTVIFFALHKAIGTFFYFKLANLFQTAKNLGIISEFLETYKGRDKVLRALSYMAKMGTGLTTEETAKKLKIFGSQMSGCRVMLRLLDDIPMLHYALLYNSHYKVHFLSALESNEHFNYFFFFCSNYFQDPDWVIRWIDIVQIVVDVIYYPIEHIWWAGELKLIAINKDAWDVGTTYFWLISLYLSLMR